MSVQGGWPLVCPSSRLFVQAGSQITFWLDGISDFPEAVSIAVYDRSGLRLEKAPPGPVYSCDVTPSFSPHCRGGKSSVSFTWTVPGLPARNPWAVITIPQFAVQVPVVWVQPLPASVTYCASIDAADATVSDLARRTALRFFDATWRGDEETVSALLGRSLQSGDVRVSPDKTTAAVSKEGDAGELQSGPFLVTEKSPMNLIAWRPGKYEFALVSGRWSG